jgi:hypothetical protein
LAHESLPNGSLANFASHDIIYIVHAGGLRLSRCRRALANRLGLRATSKRLLHALVFRRACLSFAKASEQLIPCGELLRKRSAQLCDNVAVGIMRNSSILSLYIRLKLRYAGVPLGFLAA